MQTSPAVEQSKITEDRGVQWLLILERLTYILTYLLTTGHDNSVICLTVDRNNVGQFVHTSAKSASKVKTTIDWAVGTFSRLFEKNTLVIGYF